MCSITPHQSRRAPPAKRSDESSASESNDSPIHVEHENTLLIKGRPLPPLSDDVTIPRRAYNLHKGCAIYSISDVPSTLKDLGSDLWRKGGFLKDISKRPSGRGKTFSKAFLAFSYCLLVSTTTLVDHMVIVNMWICLSDDERRIFQGIHKELYAEPSRSNILKLQQGSWY
jgi:hypothetical protein